MLLMLLWWKIKNGIVLMLLLRWKNENKKREKKRKKERKKRKKKGRKEMRKDGEDEQGEEPAEKCLRTDLMPLVKPVRQAVGPRVRPW